MKNRLVRFLSQHFPPHPWLCGLVMAASLWHPFDLYAQQVNPTGQAVVAPQEFSPEGRQMLTVTILLAGSLLGMERVCAWRLSARQRRTFTSPPVQSAVRSAKQRASLVSLPR